MKHRSKRKQGHMAHIGLPSSQVRFLEDLIHRMTFSGGRRLSRSQVVSALVRSTQGLGVDVGGVKTERDLVKRFLAAYRHQA